MYNRRKYLLIAVVILMFLMAFNGNAGEIDAAASEVTQDVNGVLLSYINFLQWVITAVMLLITVVGIFPELFAAGRTPDLSGIFMKFIQAAVIISITWAIGDLITTVFGVNIDFYLII